ncbi:MAG: hypothetical protein A2066_00310 [Bacteroidetes bacterium GWB2_41_8]|nr:MAG: hypothetical protein A2066_00310 [Bacteroidetes bacterium GWB2_41_8]
MIQDIIAYLIIVSAFGILTYRILQFFNLTRKKADKCGGCSTGCSLKELHVVNKAKFDKKELYRFYQ